MTRRRTRIFPRILAAFSVLAIMASGGILFHLWLFARTPGKSDLVPRRVEIPPGTGRAAIARLLLTEGVISDDRLFQALTLLTRTGNRLKAGEYSFPALATPAQVLQRIATGRVVVRHLTFPEGSNLRDVARIFDRSGLTQSGEILRLAHDRDFIRSLGLDVNDLEGYLFPETYFFRKSQDAEAMLRTMVNQFSRNFDSKLQARANEVGKSVQEVVILASLVEKEAAVDEDRPLIASVLLNRLQRKMPLQSDPTAIYDLPDYDGPVTWLHLKRPSPYNTYYVRGLPAGPICNPGIRSIRAVLYPADTKYLYFVSNADGTHRFSETLTEHNRAVSAYARKKRAAAQTTTTGSDSTPKSVQESKGKP